MSLWCQVNGSIELDGLNDACERKIAELLGEITHPQEGNVRFKLPYGSEGSLEYRIIRSKMVTGVSFNEGNQKVYHYGRGFIFIFGRLRDYPRKEGIIEWFKDTIQSLSDYDVAVKDYHLKVEFDHEE